MHHLKFLYLIALVAPLAHAETAIEPAQVRTAVEKSIALLQSTGEVWFSKRPCTSCDDSILPTLALLTARRHGIAIDETLARDHFHNAYSALGCYVS